MNVTDFTLSRHCSKTYDSKHVLLNREFQVQFERRTSYRTDEPEDLRANVLQTGHPPIPGELIDCSTNGVAIRFSMPGRPVWEIGQEVGIEITSDHPRNLLIPTATVTHRNDGHECCHYGFEFNDCDLIYEELSPALARIFNRRGVFRVRADSVLQIEVTLTGNSGKEIRARLTDISGSGIGVQVLARSEHDFSQITDVAISFSLPTSNSPLHLTGVIRNRWMLDPKETGMYYGIDFDPVESEEGRRQKQVILNFVNKRSRESLGERGQ